MKEILTEIYQGSDTLAKAFLHACLFQELALVDDANASTLILMGIEEPEIYQHPPQARYLAETLLDYPRRVPQLCFAHTQSAFHPRDNFTKIRIVREKAIRVLQL